MPEYDNDENDENADNADSDEYDADGGGEAGWDDDFSRIVPSPDSEPEFVMDDYGYANVGRAPICSSWGVTALPAHRSNVIDSHFVCDNDGCDAFGEAAF